VRKVREREGAGCLQLSHMHRKVGAGAPASAPVGWVSWEASDEICAPSTEVFRIGRATGNDFCRRGPQIAFGGPLGGGA
jgi:hypothetical protein